MSSQADAQVAAYAAANPDFVPEPSALDDILARMPGDAAASFSDAQRAALRRALGSAAAVEPAPARRVNIRLSVPAPGGRWFLTLVAGRDRRGPRRRAQERKLHPLQTFANFLFIVGVLVGIYALAFFGILFYSRIVEF